ncbi:hypothetical protein EV646_114176 [Kribbella antiqua]|uniref:Uncharacterized protein n=1 Tax=Kribbella antiqua TaxID=2512217 RepID=A0A4R2IDT4_9ACTN|nr:hypothetical protein EV646_114176 [Kribbella antiqua]
MGCEVARRLVILLRILERGPAPYGVLGEDAILDAWFGIRAPILPEPVSYPRKSANSGTSSGVRSGR